MKKILLAGATGFVGQALLQHLLDKGYQINALSRKKTTSHSPNLTWFNWDPSRNIIQEGALEDVSVIINLTGANIGEKRWTASRKKEILESRINVLNLLYQAAEKAQEEATKRGKKSPLNTLISSSAVGFYGAVNSEHIFKEEDPVGQDFLAEVCQAWEAEAKQFQKLGLSTYILRKGIVMGENGGMIKKLSPMAKLGINTSLGSGNQYMPWIAIEDLLAIYDRILKEAEIPQEKADIKIFNTVRDEALQMNDLSKALLKAYNKANLLPNVPGFLIKLIFGEMSIMLLKGSRISNQKLKDHYKDLNIAWNQSFEDFITKNKSKL